MSVDASHIKFHFDDSDNDTTPSQPNPDLHPAPLEDPEEHARFMPKNQSGTFEYGLVRKPPFVTPVVFWRVMKLFKGLDPGCAGFVQLDTLVPTLQGVLQDDLLEPNSINIIIQEVMNAPARTGQSVVTVEYFLEILDHVMQNFEANAPENKALGVDRLATHLEDEGLEEFHDETCCQIWAKDCTNRMRSNARHQKKFGFDFTKIESRFGSSVASYFYFAQSMFFFNLVVSLFFMLVLVPGMIHYDWSHTKPGFQSNSYYGLAFGAGMENSWLFYGYYQTTYWTSYNMEMAYVLVLVFMFVASLYVILKYMQAASDVNDEELDSLKVCRHVLAGYDFSLQDRQIIELQLDHQNRTIKTLLQEIKETDLADRHEQAIGGFERQAKRYLGYFLTLLLIGGSCVVVAVLIYFEETTIAPALSTNASLARFAELLVPAAVSFLRVSSPFIIFAIVALESYELADKRFFHTFSRLFATRMFYVLVILFQTMFMQVSGVPGDADYVCPETQVGVFYYSLVFLDIIIDAGLSIVAPWVKMKARKCLGRGVAGEFDSHYKGLDQYKDEFPIPVNIINIMYQQGLIWSGMPYCPALPVLGSLSLFLTIIVKRLQVINLCRPPVKPMGVARQQSYFRSLLIVTLVIAMIPFSFFMRTTATCGPYFAADVYIADDSTTWTTPVDRLWEEIEKLPAWVVMVFNYLQNVVVLWVVLIVLVIYTLYLRKTMVAVRGELHYAQDRVKLEQKDLQEIIKKEKIILDETQEKGRTQFQHWMLGEDMVHFSDRYRILFQTNYFDDIFELSKLTDHELRELISEWRGPHGEAILPGHLSFFIRKLGEKRLDLVT